MSFEIFSPNSKVQATKTMALVERFQRLQQSSSSADLSRCALVSITQGSKDLNALTSTAFARDLLATNKVGAPLDLVMHLTCSTTTKSGVSQRLEDWQALGINKVLALRGDHPAWLSGAAASRRLRQGARAPLFLPPMPSFCFQSSLELIERLHQQGFEPWASGHPLPHAASYGVQDNLDWTRRKLDAGATTLITQLCFDAEAMLEWGGKIRQSHPEVRIKFGVLPIKSRAQILKLYALNHLEPPQSILDFIQQNENAQGELPVAIAQRQIWRLCTQLAANGFDDFHFYSFNRPEPSLWALGQSFGKGLSTKKILRRNHQTPAGSAA